MTVETFLTELDETARRLQAQAGMLKHQLGQPTVDLAAAVQTLMSIEDTASAAIQHLHTVTKGHAT
jgi:hypothetical protein